MSDSLSPLGAYQQAIELHNFVPDAAQRRAAQLLQECYLALQHTGEPLAPITGVYLWGPVGRGKTWLMDSFYQSLRVPARRQHFHHFMRWVHIRLFQLTGTADPLRALARELSSEVRVLCFDELFVNDIGDAIILGRLLQVMFEEGVVLVATSNQPPEQLYADGFNRQRFEPAIAAINRYMQVVSVDGGQDHRLHPGAAQQRYWLSAPGQASPLQVEFCRLAAGALITNTSITLGHRQINVQQQCGTLIHFRYADLCTQPLSAIDFIGLCDGFLRIFISAVPNLSSQQRAAYIARGTEDGVERVATGDRQLADLSVHDDSVRRFIALVDECYDRRIALYLEAAVPLAQLYTQGSLGFAFRRTLSRLQEMQLQRYAVAAPLK
ncbi:MAG: cell division protein ZapE [Pseudomonas sp.]|uniref:cell division protein ZapE n=1 Tax=Pseudomonas sp. TaxID=306 RepID=UPI00273765DC|nr:cell division protein ZapE [Pseudomonas sp.]MDP3845145.1 cell division protein ZapE [Pseudomonas sp.]